MERHCGGSARTAGPDLWSELFYHVFAFQIPDFDAWACSSTEPVSVGREYEAVDGIGVVESVQVFAIIQIPQHGFGVLSTGGTQGTIGRHGDGVQVASVSNVVGL